MEKKYLIHSLEEMNAFALKLIPFCFPGSIIGLEGDLGSGKTTLTKFLARHLGITETVNSPTFTILKVYPGERPLYHMDVYRLEGIGYDYELDDFIYGKGVAVIEWYPFILEMLPKEFLEIHISLLEDGSREVLLKGSGIYEEILQTIGN
ncbi:MAG: tRNA (adenosine(37)-N6)-threonylcarbamoyltransferase complex ATPase subunit type 1 TsaE [Candidatus Izemoplasmatales bacterium]